MSRGSFQFSFWEADASPVAAAGPTPARSGHSAVDASPASDVDSQGRLQGSDRATRHRARSLSSSIPQSEVDQMRKIRRLVAGVEDSEKVGA